MNSSYGYISYAQFFFLMKGRPRGSPPFPPPPLFRPHLPCRKIKPELFEITGQKFKTHFYRMQRFPEGKNKKRTVESVSCRLSREFSKTSNVEPVCLHVRHEPSLDPVFRWKLRGKSRRGLVIHHRVYKGRKITKFPYCSVFFIPLAHFREGPGDAHVPEGIIGLERFRKTKRCHVALQIVSLQSYDKTH